MRYHHVMLVYSFIYIPYSGKLSREKTFAFRYKTRISRIKLSLIAPVQLLCRCGPRACATHPHTHNVRIADCKNGETDGCETAKTEKVFSLESFPLYGILKRVYIILVSRGPTTVMTLTLNVQT